MQTTIKIDKRQSGFKIKFNCDHGSKKANSVITVLEFKDFAKTIYGEFTDVNVFLNHLVERKTVSIVYPKYFVGEIYNGTKRIVYSRQFDVSGVPHYSCVMSLVPVPINNLIKSDYIPLFDDAEFEKYTKSIRKKISSCHCSTLTLDGKILEPGTLIYFFDLVDGATGEVRCFDGMESKYPNDEYQFFLSKEERDSVAYRVCQGKFIEDNDPFLEVSFTGAEIIEALRENEEYDISDEYWDMANAILSFLKNVKKRK